MPSFAEATQGIKERDVRAEDPMTLSVREAAALLLRPIPFLLWFFSLFAGPHVLPTLLVVCTYATRHYDSLLGSGQV